MPFRSLSPAEQALKANPEAAPQELRLNANYVTRFGQVRAASHAHPAAVSTPHCAAPRAVARRRACQADYTYSMQVALTEAVDQVYDMGGGKTITVSL
jgi:hypothetical protein